MADLVTLADPTSPYSFLNYLKETAGSTRSTSARTSTRCAPSTTTTAAGPPAKLSSVRFGTTVPGDQLRRRACTARRGRPGRRRGATAPGTWCSAPAPRRTSRRPCAGTWRRRLSSTTPTTCSTSGAAAQGVITIVGSGQSAAEIYYDLLSEIDVHGYQLNWVTRSPRFFPLEYTKLTLEMTSPEYIDYFHALPEEHPLPARSRARRASTRASTPS